MRRAVAAALLVSLALAGCRLPERESVLEHSDVATRLEASLGIRLAERWNADYADALPDVETSYLGETKSERLLVVVFRSARAPVQLLGTDAPRTRDPQALRHRNVVVLYTHARGAPSRANTITAALRGVPPDG